MVGFRQPKPGESQASYDRALATYRALPSTKGKQFMENPYQQYVMSQERLAQERLFNQDMRSLRNQEMSITGNLANQKLQLQLAGDANKERMYYHAQDLQQKRENDRYRTTAGLIQGLGALGAAFAL